MTARRRDQSPLDRVAEALVLADTVDVASIESLERAAAALQKWNAEHGIADARGPVEAFAKAVRKLRRDPDAGPRELEAVGDLFFAVDRALASLRRPGVAAPAPGAPAPTPAAAPLTPAVTGGQGAAPQLAHDPEMIADFVTRAGEHLDSAEEQLIILEKDPLDGEAINAAFRAFHTIKGMAGFLSLTDIQALSHSTEGALDGPRHGTARLGSASLQQLFTAIDALRVLVTEAAAAAHGSDDRDEDVEAGAVAVPEWKPDSVAPQAAVTRTVRVDEERLDRLVDTIGELVIAESMASEAVRELGGEWNSLGTQFAHLDKITRRLQEMATSLRMVPLKSTFRRLARQARDMAKSAGKQIDFVISGEDTELDKEMVDRIVDPLTHLLRNAVDHGLEDPDGRKKARKAERGRIDLRAYHRGGVVNIEVADDGRGLDLAAIAAKGRAAGLISEDAQMTERDLMQLVFEPGFSTAAEITDVSGRGVGMDVVKRVAEGLRGHVEVGSTPGQGTRFTIKLPLTLAIIEGMVLRVAEERYIVPLTAIERSVRPEPSHLATALGGAAEMLDAGDGLVPLIRLDALFGVGGAEQDPTEGVVVVVSEGPRRAGLLCCELLGQQHAVIKPLGDAFQGTSGLAGGAIMPDGRVGLILDVAGLVQLANNERG